MEPVDDSALLRQYCDGHSDDAFAALVMRHINLVYSVAFREVGNAHHAEEITQAVFIIMARKAGGLRHDKALSSWLFQTTHLTAQNLIRSEMRRHRREQEAYMQSMLEEPESGLWERITPLLDTAVASLREKDRRAIVLRFYEGRSLREVASALGTSEEASKKRVSRALEKLQNFFGKQGVTSTAATIAEAISANSVQVAPAALAKSVTAIAATKGAAASASTLTVIKGALKIMAWTKAKTAVVVGISVLLAAGTATVCVRQIKNHRAIDPQTLDESFWRFDIKTLMSAPQVAAVRPSRLGQTAEMSTDTRMLAHGASLGALLYYAYASNNIYYQFPNHEFRTILAPGVSDGRFDLLLTTTNHPQEALQAEIKKDLGVVAHFEPRDTDVLVLKSADTMTPRLTPSVGIGSVSFGRGRFNFTNQPAYTLVNFVQNNFDTLVDDQSGLTEQYTGSLKWAPQADKTANQREIQTALSNQLGLELVSGHETVQILVVEKAN